MHLPDPSLQQVSLLHDEVDSMLLLARTLNPTIKDKGQPVEFRRIGVTDSTATNLIPCLARTNMFHNWTAKDAYGAGVLNMHPLACWLSFRFHLFPERD